MIRRFITRWGIGLLACVLMITSLISVPESHGATNHRVEAAKEKRPLYRIEARYDEATSKVTGHVSVQLPVWEKAMGEVYFHLYPNAFQHWKWGEETKPRKPGYLKVENIQVDQVKADHQVKETLLKVQLPEGGNSNDRVTVSMDYELKLPQGGSRLNKVGKTAFLAQWYPMLAVYDRDGWHTDPYTATGDPFFSQISDFDVTFHVPKGYQVITSADDSKGGSDTTVTLRQTGIRDFAAVLSQDYKAISGKAGKVRVNLWYQKGMEDVVQPLHEVAVDSMKFFCRHFGSYPYNEVDVVLGETGYGIAGMEYPGLVTSVDKIPTRQGMQPAANVVAHELAHQWWYGVVGNDQVKEPWLDEGLTTFSEMLFMHDKVGADEEEWLVKAAERSEAMHKENGITSVEPLYKYPDPVYGLMVYTRPAAMLWNLMDEIGKDKVLDILRAYYDQYRFRIATTSDFIRVANEVSGKDLTDFFNRWLYFNES